METKNFNTSKGTKTINNYEEKGLTDVYYWIRKQTT